MTIDRETLGWIGFILSACCYVIAGLQSGDPLSIAGSILFLGACFFFIRWPSRPRPDSPPRSL